MAGFVHAHDNEAMENLNVDMGSVKAIIVQGSPTCGDVMVGNSSSFMSSAAFWEIDGDSQIKIFGKELLPKGKVIVTMNATSAPQCIYKRRRHASPQILWWKLKAAV